MKKILALALALVMVLALAIPSAFAADTGRVYWLNMKPEADEALQAMAKVYEEATGVPTKIVTAASGTYSDTLTAEMAKSEAPTLFNIGNGSALLDWDDYALALDGAAVLDELTTKDFNLVNEAGETKALGWIYESFGIIVNKALLEKAGHSLDEITNFDSLKAVADDIHARADELGFDAFTSAGLDDSSAWRFTGHLANLPLFYEFRDEGINTQPATLTGAYVDNFRAIWDLYIDDAAAEKTSLTTATGDQAEAEFGEGKAVFYQNGTWEWSAMVDKFGLNPDDITMIPIYCGVAGEEDAGLCSGTENCLAVNAKVSEADQKATLDFLLWCVTSEEGIATLSSIGDIPFKAAPASANGFSVAGSDLLASGKYAVTWAFNYTPNVDSWRTGVKDALAKYSADQTDANWADVTSAFVDGWAIEYNMVNG
ncbi:MAG: carbohydrate ABC transporter substrate-binding protein [Oscillospiraceae bacterium]|nr:carbohydrate ABC transporter substrate-binding protein [Oscillospiraceae bacterium]